MRQKINALRSARSDKYLDNENIGYFRFSFAFSEYCQIKNENSKDSPPEISVHEKRFCKINNIPFKTYMEIKNLYKKKGKYSAKQFMKTKKIRNSKFDILIEFLKKR